MMAGCICRKILWSILLCSLLIGITPAQDHAVPQGDSQALVHGLIRSSLFYNKNPFRNPLLSQGASSSERSDFSSVFGSYQTRNASRSDEPALRRLASANPWHSFMPSSSNDAKSLGRRTPLVGERVPSGSSTEAVGFQGGLPIYRRAWSPVQASSFGDSGYGTSWANPQDAAYPFYQGYGQDVGIPAMRGPQGSGYGPSPQASLGRLRPHAVPVPSQLLVPQVVSSPAQMPTSQGEHVYSHVSYAPAQGTGHNVGSVPSWSYSPRVGSVYGFSPSKSPAGEDGVSEGVWGSASNAGIVPPVASQGGPAFSQAAGLVSSSAPVQLLLPQTATYPYSFAAPSHHSGSVLSQPSSLQMSSGPASVWHVPSPTAASPGVYSTAQDSYGTWGGGGGGAAAASTWVAGFQPGSDPAVVPQVGAMAGQTAVPLTGFAPLLPGSGQAASPQSGYLYSHVGSVPGFTAAVPGWPTWPQIASDPASSGVPHTTGHSGSQFPGYVHAGPGQTVVPGHATVATPHMVQRPYDPLHGMGALVTSGLDFGSRVGYFRDAYRSAWGLDDQPVGASTQSRVPSELCFCLKDYRSY